MKKAFIIAEAGVNHNGNIEIARKMVDAAFQAGADAIKFQTFKAERILSNFAPKAEYQKRTTGSGESQFSMLKRLELDITVHKKLINCCREKGIIFLSSPFDLESIELLDNLGMKVFKIPSGEITNLPYLKKIGNLRKEIIMSSGMSNLKEIKEALEVLVNAGTSKRNITILHCNTEYPTPMKDVNLLAMLTIKNAFGVSVGYSDHTLGIEVPIAAVAMGATVIEKHFTLDKTMIGPDHQASLEPREFKEMTKAIRNIELAFGSGIKKPSSSEQVNRLTVRKSILAARDIKKQETFTKENLCIKRPGKGINPMRWEEIIGEKAKRVFRKDDLIEI